MDRTHHPHPHSLQFPASVGEGAAVQPLAYPTTDGYAAEVAREGAEEFHEELRLEVVVEGPLTGTHTMMAHHQCLAL